MDAYGLVFKGVAEKQLFIKAARSVEENIFSNPDKARIDVEEAISRMEDEAILNVLQYFLAKILSAKSQYELALETAISIDTTGIKSSLKGDVFLLRARLYKYSDDFNTSLDYFRKARVEFERRNDQLGLTILFINMAEYFRAMRRYEVASEYLDRAKDLMDSETPIRVRMYQLNRAAAVNSESGDLEKAAQVCEENIVAARKSGDDFLLASAFNELGVVYIKLYQTELAIENLTEAIRIWKKTGHERYWTSAVSHLAQALIHYERYAEAEDLLIESVSTAEGNQWYGVMYTYYDLLATISISLDKSDEAMDWLRKSRLAYQEDFDFRMSERLSVKQAELKLEEEERQNRLLSERIRQERNIRIFVISAAIVLSGLVAFLMYLVRKVRTQNARIAETNSQLKSLADERQVLMKEIHHRVKNNLQVTAGMLELQSQETDKKTSGYLMEARSRIGSIAKIHEHLYQQENVGAVSFEEYLNSLIAEIGDSLGINTERIRIQVKSEGHTMGLDMAVPLGLIINELITNSILHAFPDGEGQIEISLKGDQIFELIYRDDGTGLPPDFDPVTAPSLGIRLIGLLTRQLNGDSSFRVEDGTKFVLEFPNRVAT